MHSKKYLIVFGAGLAAVFSFAPFSLFPLTVLALSLLFWQWQQADDKWQSAWLGFVFGLGLFTGVMGWIYIALHDYGDMAFLSALAASALFITVLAVLPGFAGLAVGWVKSDGWARMVLVMPALWVLLEWLRGLLFTGFPWLAMGYSQITASPLTGYAPVLGVYGVSLAVALSAGLLVVAWQAKWGKQRSMAMMALVLLWGSGAVLRVVEWTKPDGQPISVALVQGNIPQELKFREERLVSTLENYRRLVTQSNAKLIVLPETALPVLREEVPQNYLQILGNHARNNGGDLLIGAFERDQGRYYNSVFTLGTAQSQSYRKNHLVPFGEFIPLRLLLGWFINEVLHIPMSDLARGGDRQQVLHVAGQRVAVQICYEDVFGEEVIRYLPEASLLVNVSNDAWYGKSHAAIQHNQISQMRALESGRMMLRATNTGVTSIIDRDGVVKHLLPQHVEGTLTGLAQGYVGSTPYVRWGNGGMLVLGVVMLGASAVLHGRRDQG